MNTLDSIIGLLQSQLGIWLGPILFVFLAVVLYLGANSLFKRSVAFFRKQGLVGSLPFERLVWPFRLIVVLAGSALFLDYVSLPDVSLRLLKHLFLILSIVTAAWFIMRMLAVLEQFILSHYQSRSGQSEIAAKKVATNVSLARKILNALIIVLAVSGVLMTFDTVRQVGLSILASAGIAGVILGFAAQKSLGTLIAGIQIAISQPISIDDVVIVEGEWGRIEEITLTYVVVLIWDQRRMIVPITWFLDKPFQNWTRTSTELLGTVYLYVDYAIPVESIRQELESIVASTPLWDKRVVRLHVTKATDKTVELRALMSAANSSDLWELRCLVRERLIDFIRINYPAGLPKVRMEVEGGAPVAVAVQE
ncbi:MscS Mechanosensitive ion channel [Chlorobaculum parvum NCIB 8327]|uniref:MscS Mechanosensitive ion channel n=1 Tax=Chlorobaculum parvum (strain DSM 263 / NCIMB 8327) TaxID=517417 RepID=B3QQV3_CHLP8|nr:mechanosensitive ion channel domain-containing protein [Chlorobaculum parvum]ACF10731.1 MscS Mechanosensitive ion channel [Chlorobaculum parvum NCIB 8327]